MSIGGSSRPCIGSEHLFSHALDLINAKHAMHGEQCGVGSILTAFLHGSNWQQIKATLQRIGSPITAKELGVNDADIVKALQMAADTGRERQRSAAKLNYDACETVARATGIC